MTTTGNLVTAHGRRLLAHWPALLLPLLAAGTLALVHGLAPDSPLRGPAPVLFLVATALLAVLAPERSAKIAPFALFGYGAYGLFLVHFLLSRWSGGQLFYGLVRVSAPHLSRVWGVRVEGAPASYAAFANWLPGAHVGLVLTEAVAFFAVGTWLLALTGAPGGGAVRRAAAQLRGTGGQPKTVPPLLLIPVIFIWEELLSSQLWYADGLSGPSGGAYGRMIALAIFLAGLAMARWLPRAAARLAVTGTVLIGLCGAAWNLLVLFSAHNQLTVTPGVLLYGLMPLSGGMTTLLAVLQGAALLGFGCVLALRLLTWSGDARLAAQAQALTQRVSRLTASRSDATETAVAELRRIERDLHDGAQARLVAVGMSLRAAEELMPVNPVAARALVAEARETSARALDDLRDLVRGIYPPVLADRGLAEAVRALALDAPLAVDTDITLAGEPPMPVAAAVYFGIAEALTNAARHSGAGTVQVGIGYAGGLLRAAVADDGAGGADASLGTGLSGVARRMATFDGILSVSSPVGGPTIVVIEVPCALASVGVPEPA